MFDSVRNFRRQGIHLVGEEWRKWISRGGDRLYRLL